MARNGSSNGAIQLHEPGEIGPLPDVCFHHADLEVGRCYTRLNSIEQPPRQFHGKDVVCLADLATL
jgi:hypothetical protein